MAEGRKLSDFKWGPLGDFKAWTRGLTVSVAAGVFLALSGAFGTIDMPLPSRLAYWIALMLLGTIWAGTVEQLVFGRDPCGGHVARRVVATTLLAAGPITGVVWLANTLVLDLQIGPRQSLYLLLTVMLITLAMTTLNILIEARGQAEGQPPAPPRFLERLPAKLRGADIWAVQSEDHYLRLHTSKGQDLILLRLADAVSELEGIEGAQVHRSWWVARDAIADAKRGDGRATLTLKDGSEVPVSRTYARVIREKGWI